MCLYIFYASLWTDIVNQLNEMKILLHFQTIIICHAFIALFSNRQWLSGGKSECYPSFFEHNQ